VPSPRARLVPASLRLLAASAVIACCVLDPREYVGVEHALLSERDGTVYLSLACGISALGWLLGGFRLRPQLAFASAGSAALVCLRYPVWDYYLVDVAVLAFFAVSTSDGGAGSRLVPK